MQKRLTSEQQSPSRFTGALRFLGRNSYEIYLTHVFVVLLFVREYNAMKLSGEWAWLLYLSVIVISGILGYLVARYFSTPMNMLLREKFKRISINPKP
jgi:peptidoglycan/LPS O-acetylase OafA/YrhL